MALDDPDGGAPVLAAAPLNLSELTKLSEMNQIWSGTAPQRCLIRMIDIAEVKGRDGPELRASFRNPEAAQALPAGGIEQAIRDAVRNADPARGIIAQAKEVIQRVKTFFTGSLLSPLDIELVGEPTIIVFILARPSNLEFSPVSKALTHKNLADRDGYGGLRHVTLVGDDYYEDPEPLEDCRIVHFVCAPPPTPMPPPDSYGFKHGLNLNVRLKHPDDADGTRRALDLMIDPDIRYPGQ